MASGGILGQVHPEPLLGSWEKTKAFWFEAMGYKIHADEVRDFHRSEATTLIAEAPARSSKSYAAAHDVMIYGLPSTRPVLDSRHAIVGVDYATNKEFEYVYDMLVNRRDRLAVDGLTYKVERANFNTRSGDLEVILNYGQQKRGQPTRRAVFKGLSSTNEVSLQGEQWTTVTLSEAAEHPQHILTKHFATRAWKTYLPTTPKAKAKWLKELGDAGREDPSLGVEVFRFPAHANPLYDRSNFAREEKLARARAVARLGPSATARDDPFFAEQFLGEWVYYAGRVLPFEHRRHVIPRAQVTPLLHKSQIWVSTDYGYEDPWSTGFWAVLPNGIYARFDEIYERHLSTTDFIDRLHDKLALYKIDPSRVTATGDPSRPEVARLLLDHGFSVVQIDKNAQRDRAAGKRRIVDLLTQGHVPMEGGGGFYPGLYLTENCTHAIEEFQHLHYKEKQNNEDAPTAFAGMDHAYDDTRYFVMSRPMPRREAQESDWLREYRRQIATTDTGNLSELVGTAAYA